MSHASYPDHPLDEDRLLRRILPATLMEWIDPAQADSPQALLALWRGMAPRLRELFPCTEPVPNPREFRPGETAAEAVERVKQGRLIVIGIEHDFGCIEAVDHELDPTGKNREWCWQLNRLSPSWRILAWGAEQGDAEALDALLRAVRHFLRWPVPLQENGYAFHFRAHRTIDTGIRMGGTIPIVLPTILDHADDELLLELCASLLMQQQRLRWNHRAGNWLTMEMKGLYTSTVYLPFATAAADCASYAFGMAAASIDEQILPDGMQYELAPSYHLLCANNFLPMVTLAKAVGYEHAQRDRLEQISSELAVTLGHMIMSTGRCAEPQDCDVITLRRLQAIAPDIATHERPVGLLPNAGYCVLRAGGASVFLDGGAYGHAHQHQDKLNVLYSSGDDMGLIEHGKQTYEDTVYRTLSLSSAAHNCLLVDGTGQWRSGADEPFPFAAVDFALRESDDARSVVAGYDQLYGQTMATCSPAGGGRPESGLIDDVTHRRAVHLLTAEGFEGLLVIEDEISCAQERLLTLLWHLNATTVQREDASGLVVIIGERPFTARWWSDAPLDLRHPCGREGGAVDSFLDGAPAGWTNYIAHDPAGGAPDPCLRLEVEARAARWRVVSCFAFDAGLDALAIERTAEAIVLSRNDRSYRLAPRLI